MAANRKIREPESVKVRRMADGEILTVSKKAWESVLSGKEGFELEVERPKRFAGEKEVPAAGGGSNEKEK